MAYNGYFPVGYQPMPVPQYPQIPQAAPVQTHAQSGIIWVSGEAAAKAYMTAPNTTVVLFDSENQCIYLKSADASGMPSIKTLDYTIRETAGTLSASVIGNTYATKEEFDALRNQVEGLKLKIGKAVKKGESTVSNDE